MNMPVSKQNQQPIYTKDQWENYAPLFLSITTSIQLEVYKAAAAQLSGNVADFGCGTSKIAPFLADNPAVESYTGIDYASEMIETAQWVIDTLEQPKFSVQASKIEDTKGLFSSAVSIQSYYAWPDPLLTLKHIHSLLEDAAVFVLATANKNLQLERLAKDLEKELIGHPNLQAYKDYNLQLAANPNAHFVDMAELTGQVQAAGFGVLEAHQQFFDGGLNYLIMKKL